jgi:hypothetical protein
MQASNSVQLRQRITWQIAALASAAALGVAIGFAAGTWMANDDESGVSSTVANVSTLASDRGAHIMDVKFAQMDAEDSWLSGGAPSVLGVSTGPSTAEATGADRIIDVKFAQMDAEGLRLSGGAPSVLGVSTGPSAAEATGADRIIDVKFAQMDAEDAR